MEDDEVIEKFKLAQSQLDHIEEMLAELILAKRTLEKFAESMQGMGPLGMLGALKGINLSG